jgi:hypothetical protein
MNTEPFDRAYFNTELGEFWALMGQRSAWTSGAVDLAYKGLSHIYMSLLSPEDAAACEHSFLAVTNDYTLRRVYLEEIDP